MGLPEGVLHVPNWMHHSLEPVLAVAHPFRVGEGLGHSAELIFMIISSLIAIVGIAAGVYLYRNGPDRAAVLAKPFRPVYVLLAGKWFVDEIYEIFILLPLALISKLSAWFDLGFVDGIVNGAGRTARGAGRLQSKLQSGHIQTYALWMAGGLLLILSFLAASLWITS